MIRTGKAGRYGVAILAAATLAMAACGSGTGSATNTPAQNVEIDPNAILHITAAAPIRNMDPVLQTSYGGYGYLVLAYDRLTMLDKNDNVIPGLATKWEFSKDGKYLEMKLRTDVKFHDGTAFNAAAVKANIERGKTLTTSTIKSNLADITSVDVVDDSTVRLNLVPGGGVQLPAAFVTNVGMMVSPKAIEAKTDLSKGPGDAGSGPFTVTSFTAGEKVIYKKAPGYWDPNVGRVAGMEIEPVSDTATRLKGVQTGVTDLTTISSANDLVQAQQLDKQGVVKTLTTKYRNVMGVYIRATKGDMAKPEVRQAIAYAIDPEAIKALFSGTCTPYRQFYPDSSWASIKNYTYPYAFNLDKAKSLVQSAGGAKVSVTFPPGSNVDAPANVIQSQLAAAGIDAKLNPVPTQENEPRFIAGDFELMVANSFSPPIEPAAAVSTYFTSMYKLATEPSLAQIKELGAKASDPNKPQAERAPIYQQIWELALKEAWFVPVCQLTQGTVANPKVVGADNIPWTNIGIWDYRYVAKAK